MRIAVPRAAERAAGVVLAHRWRMMRVMMFARIDSVTDVNWAIIDGGDEP